MRLPSNRRLPNAAGKKKSETAKRGCPCLDRSRIPSHGEKAINGGVFQQLSVLFQKEGRDVHRFVHRGNKVGQTIANDEGQDVVNKVGRVLEAGVRESVLAKKKEKNSVRTETVGAETKEFDDEDGGGEK